MKKYLSLALVLVCLLSLVGCGSGGKSVTGNKEITIGDTTITISKGDSDTAEPENKPEEKPIETPEVKPDETEKPVETPEVKTDETEKPVETPTENPVETPTENPVENTADKPEETTDVGGIDIGTTTKPSDGAITHTESSLESPAKLGDWHRTTRYSPTSGDYEECYYRVIEIQRGDTAAKFVDDYNNSDKYSYFEKIEDDDLEYCVIKYEMYFPEDFPAESWGISTADIDFDIKPVDSEYSSFVVDGVSYIGLGYVYDASEYIDNGELMPGDTWTGYGVFGMHKEVDEWIISNEALDAEYNVQWTNYDIYK